MTGAWPTLIVLVAAGLAIAAVALDTVIAGAPPMPLMPAARDVVVRLLAARAKGPVYDLGAGWGGVAFDLARRRPDLTVVAVERAVLPLVVLWLRRLVTRRRNLTVLWADVHRLDLKFAGGLYAYLNRPAMKRLAARLRHTAPAGIPVVSAGFTLPGWTPERILPVPASLLSPEVFLYRVPGLRDTDAV